MSLPWQTEYLPDYALTDLLVDTLRADAPLTALLFSLSQPVHPLDKRVYSAFVNLPETPPLRSQLPRVLVETLGEPVQFEQDHPSQPQEAVDVWLHVFAPADNRQLAEALAARVAYVVTSTPLSTPSIIASGLIPGGRRLRRREPAFGDAWRITSQFRAPLVGVSYA
jgi:hypothetical protein